MATIENNENWINFINKYRSLPELWNIKCDSYKNKAKKAQAYEKLAEEYRNIDESATVDTVKKRIKNMRFTYKRELKKQIASEKSGTDHLYEPNLWYFNRFQFLKQFEMPEEGTSDEEKWFSIKAPIKTAKRKKPSENYDKKELFRKTTTQMENLKNKNERDEADIYGEGWAHSYRKLSTEQKLFAKKACDEIFLLGQLEKLTFNSVKTETTPFSTMLCNSSSSCNSLPQILSVQGASNCQLKSDYISKSPSPNVYHEEVLFKINQLNTEMEFDGKVVLITGASSGIGAATAQEFSKLGAQLVLVGRNIEKLKETAEKCLDTYNHLQLQADISNERDVEKIIHETLANYQKIDVLVNAADIIECGGIENTSLEQYDRVMNTNMRSIYQLTMLAVPELKKTKGNIINITSVCGRRAFPNVLAYNISKTAVDQFTRCVASELAAAGVRCNSVNPGVIVTELHELGGMNDEDNVKFLEHCKVTHPLGRTGHADEVSGVICFLASDKTSFITGVNMPVDGGRHAMCSR